MTHVAINKSYTVKDGCSLTRIFWLKTDLRNLEFRCVTQTAIFTARVRSTREGTVFTGVCLLTFGGGTYLSASGWGGTYLPRSGWGGGVPTLAGWVGGTYLGWVGGVPTLAGWGVPTFPGLDGGGYLLWWGAR